MGEWWPGYNRSYIWYGEKWLDPGCALEVEPTALLRACI